VPVSYSDVASLAFGSRPFSVREFAAKTGTLRAVRLLSEMKSRGLVERIGRGRYRILSPDERPDLRALEWSRVNRLLLSADLPMAWAGVDAVRVWTGGRYTVSPSAFLREFHIEVPKSAEGRWRSYLRSHRISSDTRRRIGSKVIITPSSHYRPSTHRGEPVIPRGRTLAMIRAHRGIYANADTLVEH